MTASLSRTVERIGYSMDESTNNGKGSSENMKRPDEQTHMVEQHLRDVRQYEESEPLRHSRYVAWQWRRFWRYGVPLLAMLCACLTAWFVLLWIWGG